MRALLLFVLCFGLACGPAAARPRDARRDAPVPEWSQLDAGQRHALARFGPRWDRMPPMRRVLLLRRYERWQHWSPQQRQDAREGLRNYRALSPRQRAQMRRSVQALRGLDEPERARLRATWRALSPEARREWLRAGGPGIAPPPGEVPRHAR